MPNPSDLLTLRAIRILQDNRQHSAETIEWAIRQTSAVGKIPRELERELMPRFTLRELSLGAQKW